MLQLARRIPVQALMTLDHKMASSLFPHSRARLSHSWPSHEIEKSFKIPFEIQTRLSIGMLALDSPYTNLDNVCHGSHALLSSELPPALVAAIQDFRSNGLAPGAMVVSGLPLDPILPMTPARGERSTEKTSFVSEGCLLGIATYLGRLLSYPNEKNGDLIHNICPVKSGETVQSNESSKIDLSLHVENAYLDNRPDFLALFCLRQDHKQEALTSFIDVRSIVSEMDEADIAELQRPKFIVPSPPSHQKATGGVEWSAARPIFEDFDHPNFICHFPGMKALDEKAQQALDKFEEIANRSDLMSNIALEPGSLLLLNNRKVAHGRSQFEPRYDGTDRWLQRIYIKQ